MKVRTFMATDCYVAGNRAITRFGTPNVRGGRGPSANVLTRQFILTAMRKRKQAEVKSLFYITHKYNINPF